MSEFVIDDSAPFQWSHEYWKDHPVNYVGEQFWCFNKSMVRAWMYMEIEHLGPEYDPELRLCFAGDSPHPEHWLGYELDMVGWDGIFGYDEEFHKDTVAWMMRQGIAPEQLFLVEFNFAGGWAGEEYDYTISFDIIDEERWSLGKAVAVWATYLHVRDNVNVSVEDATKRTE